MSCPTAMLRTAIGKTNIPIAKRTCSMVFRPRSRVQMFVRVTPCFFRKIRPRMNGICTIVIVNEKMRNGFIMYHRKVAAVPR